MSLAQLTWRNWSNLIGYIVMVVFTRVMLGGLTGPTNEEISAKYQTLVTPHGPAFAMWGPIFIGEAIFAVCQMLPRYRGAKVVELVTPGWLATCLAQASWSVFWSQEWMPGALACMLGMLAGLLWVAASTDGLVMTWEEYGVLRWPLSVHLGWVIAASVVNSNVLMDSLEPSKEVLLGFAITCVGAACIVVSIITFAKVSADPPVCFVAAWAFYWISVELANPTLLDSPDRFAPYLWDRVTIGGLRVAASNVAWVALALMVVAIGRVSWNMKRTGSGDGKGDASAQELVAGSALGA